MKYIIKVLFSVGVLTIVNGCTAIDTSFFHKKEKQLSSLSIGVVGLDNGVFESGFEPKAMPYFEKKLAVHLQSKGFSASSFRRFEKIRGSDTSALRYVDSLPNKPSFVEIELVDDIAYATAMRMDANRGVCAFAKANSETRVVTKLALVFKHPTVFEHGAYYITKGKNGATQLEGVSKDGRRMTYQFSEAIIFDYELSYFCWGTNTYGKIEAFDLVEEGKSCKTPLSRKAKTFAKEKNLETF